MGTKICMNSSCGTAATREWKRGWPLRSGLFADLCYTCGSAYEKSVYCDTFHLEESGWRECSICGKRLHCGCIASKSLVELLDYGGVGCASCATSSRLHSIQGGRIQRGFGSLTTSSAVDAKSSTVEDRVAGNCIEEGNLPQLCRFNEANDTNLTCQPVVGDGNACHQQFRQEEIRHPIANAAQLTFDSSKFGQPDNIRSMLDMRNTHGSLAQPSSSMTLGAPPGKETFAPFSSIPTPFQQGQRSRLILPKPSKAGFAMNPQNNKTMASELRIARPPGEGRGKSQLLPRYWPRITDQELQQISGDLNSTVVPLFEKVLSASDAGRIGRLVLPKACAEAYFPAISQSEGVPLRIQDVKGREWTFQFRFWPNNNSRMYVLEGVTPCIQAMQLRAGDTITFSRIDPSGKLVVGYRKATNVPITSQDGQQANLTNGPTSGETSYSADGDAGLNKSENSGGRTNGDSLQEPIPNTEKKRTRNIGPKSKRLLMHSEDALELRLTWEEAQELLRPSPSAKPSVVTIEDHEFEEYDEPPVFGKRTLFTAQPSGLQEQWAQCDDCSKWRKLPVDALLPPKWTCSDNAWDASRCTCSAPEEMTAKDLDNLLRGSKDLKKRRIMGSHNRSEDCEPSGLDALASAAVLGDSVGDSGEPSVGATTRHPRHRPGCTCIVCIQPPSGKGKHKPNCTCNVCMTVKRRFKTLMLRKKKRQSEREAEILQRENIERRDESEINGSLDSAIEVNQNRNLNEAAETSAAQIDLNCHPNRDDMQVDVQGVSVMNLVNAANPALDNYDRQNGLANLISENGVASSLLPQANGENLRRLSDEAFLASIGWDREGRNN